MIVVVGTCIVRPNDHDLQMEQEKGDHRHYQDQGDDPCAGGGDATKFP
jgi:hypothetical protein